MDMDEALRNMLTQQFRAWGILDNRILELYTQVPREGFVPERYRKLAYGDTQIPIGHGEVMMHPKEEAHLLLALDIKKTDSVLEVGTGSGFMTTLLSKQAREITSVDIVSDFLNPAAEKLAEHGVSNATLMAGNAAMGWEKNAPYDKIAITGSLPFLPDAFREQLQIGGRLFGVIGQAPAMTAMVITRVGPQKWEEHHLFETVVPPLRDALQPQPFDF